MTSPPRALLLTVLSVAVCAAAPSAQRAAFRGGVDLVSLSVTVTGPGGRFISDLATEEFTILEDGRPQAITFFERARTPLAVSLLIDSSGSMQRALPLAQRAAADFVARLRPGDVAQVIDFDRGMQVLQPFTNDAEALERAIRRMRARGSTSMYNAVYIALRELASLAAPEDSELRRDVIVVLSDGEDTSSVVTFDHLVDGAKRSPTVIYAIGLGLGGVPARRGAVHPEFALRTLAQETGGRLFLPRDATGLSHVYGEIADELASQYVLGYVSNNPQSSGWRRLSVRVARPSTQARTRAGYYAGSRVANAR